MRHSLSICLVTAALASLAVRCKSDVGPDREATGATGTGHAGLQMATATGPLTAREGHTATLLPDGTLLLAGGRAIGGSPMASAELYDIATSITSMVAPMSVPRSGHTAVLLRNGKVLVLGGAGSSAGAELYDATAHGFAPAATAGSARSGHTATLLKSGKVLVVGGRNAAGQALASAEIYDPVQNSFSPTGGLKGARYFHTASVLADDRVLIAGGVVEPVGAEAFELYDPASGTFSPVATAAASAAQHSATVLADGKVLVAHGSYDGTIFDMGPPAAATPLSLSGPRERHVAALLPNDHVLVAGGSEPICTSGCGGAIASGYVWNPSGGATVPAPLSTKRVGHTATVLPTGNVLIVGGGYGADSLSIGGVGFGADLQLADSPSDRGRGAAVLLPGGKVLIQNDQSARLFDEGSSKSASAGALSVMRTGAAVVVSRDGRALFIGGRTSASTYHASIEAFDAVSGAFKLLGASLKTARAFATATLLPSGQVLVAGGEDASGALLSAELYDPDSDSVSSIGALHDARSDHAAALLATGKVLLVGGRQSWQPLSSAEIYDPVTGQFSLTGALSAARTEPTLTLLASGKALVTGGSTSVEFSVAFAELYDPVAGVFAPEAAVNVPVRGTAATLLPWGQVLLSGGRTTGNGSATTAVWLFDPAGAPADRFVSGNELGQKRRQHAATLLRSGAVLLSRGYDDPCPPGSCLPPTTPFFDRLWSDGLGTLRRPKIASAPAAVVAGSSVTLVGAGFVGSSDASSGTTNASPSNVPVAVWQPLNAQGLVYGTLSDWTDKSATWRVPTTALHGRGLLRVITAGIPSAAVEVEIQPAPLSVACSVDAACASGHCSGGVCCDAACDGPCEACTAALKGGGDDGQCGSVPYGLSTTDACFKGDGASCSTSAECGSAQCVDGVCCNDACTGQCEACDLAGALGQCVAVVDAPHGSRPACDPATPGEPCSARACDGKVREACNGHVGGDVECAPASCSNGVAKLAASCDGQGACGEQVATSCAPNACANDACGSGLCSSNADCHPEYRCSKGTLADKGECVLANATECDGEHTLISADQSTEDCSPYRCTAAGTCPPSCDSSLDCVRGYACNAAGQCIEERVESVVDGCGCRTPGSRRSRWWPPVVGAFAVMIMTRRRRAKKPRS